MIKRGRKRHSSNKFAGGLYNRKFYRKNAERNTRYIYKNGIYRGENKWVDMFQYDNWYYHIDYVDEYKSIVIETTDNYEYAKNRAMEDDDWYDLTDSNVLSILINDLTRYYM